MKEVSKKWVYTIMMVAIVISGLLGYELALAVNPSSTFTISPGVHPGAPSYTVWAEGSYYFAKDSNGVIDFSGTDLDTLEQSVLANLTSGVVYLKDLLWNFSVPISQNVMVIQQYQGSITYLGGSLFGSIGGQLGLPFNRISDTVKHPYTYLDTCDVLTGHWTTSGTVAVETGTNAQGNASIKFTAVNLAVANIYNNSLSLDLTGKHVAFWVKVVDFSAIDYLTVKLGTNSSEYYEYNPIWPSNPNLYFENGTYLSFNNGSDMVSKSGSPSWSNISYAFFSIGAKAGKTADLWLDDIRIVPNAYQGMITFRWDDVYSDVMTIAKPALDTYGFKGVIATPSGLVGTSSGRLALANLQTLYGEGWDLVAHGYSSAHLNYSAMSYSDAVQDMIMSQQYLIQNGFYRGSRFFIPPAHVIPNNDIMQAIEKYYLACQWLTLRYEDMPVADPYRLQSYYANGQSVATIEAIIDTAKATNTWLTIWAHSASDYDIATIANYVNTSGLKVVTFSDVFDVSPNLPSFITENSGKATISSSTGVVVNHGLAGEPTVVTVTPESTGYGQFAVTARTSTTFTINVTTPGTYTFDWHAEYKP